MSVLILLSILILPRIPSAPETGHVLVSLLFITLINIVAWFILQRGIERVDRDGAIIMLAGIAGKFLLYLLYILVFWLVTKSLTKGFIIVFFALYLSFTVFLAGHLLKLLKNK
jgi:hypothetical protein